MHKQGLVAFDSDKYPTNKYTGVNLSHKVQIDRTSNYTAGDPIPYFNLRQIGGFLGFLATNKTASI